MCLLIGIGCLNEIESVRRRIEAEGRPVFGVERSFQIVRRPFAFTNKHKAADHGTHLMVEERARGDLDFHFFAKAADDHAVDGFDRAGRLAVDRPEGREIMRTDKELCGIMHGFMVQ